MIFFRVGTSAYHYKQWSHDVNLKTECVVVWFYSTLFISAPFGPTHLSSASTVINTFWDDQQVANSIKCVLTGN